LAFNMSGGLQPKLVITIADGAPIPTAPTPITPQMPVNPFVDVLGTDWFIDDVIYVYDKGLMMGTNTEPMRFSPQMTTTRAMIVTILYRMEGEPGATGFGNPFSDVAAGQWYTDAVLWAAANGIVSGYGDGIFGTDDEITREDLVVILDRYAFYARLTLPAIREYIGFADDAEIASYAKGAVEKFYKAGIVNGMPHNLFDPLGDAKRAEVAAMLHRFLEAAER
ncbi:MAG: S-layer homology domain-containing protein, partial [Oscillospiraceae bacterium]|nr:S-layer homology domain-containing protein [Oscillospiraceae bacterium]